MVSCMELCQASQGSDMFLPEIPKCSASALQRQGAIFLDDEVRHQQPDIFEDSDSDTSHVKSIMDLTKHYLELEREKKPKRGGRTKQGNKEEKVA